MDSYAWVNYTHINMLPLVGLSPLAKNALHLPGKVFLSDKLCKQQAEQVKD